MTSGTKTSNFSVPNVWCRQKQPGGQWVNHHRTTVVVVHTKTWSGSDRPKVAKSPSNGERRFYRSYTWKRDSKNRPYKSWFSGSFRVRPPMRKAERDLLDAPHPYTMSLTRKNDAICAVTNGAGVVTEWTGDDLTVWASSGEPALTFDSNDQIKLVGSLKEAFAGSDFNMAVFLGEGHQTVSMLGKTAVTMAQSFSYLKRGNVALAAQTLGVSWHGISKGDAASTWLQWAYGWKPLMGDMKAGAEQLAHILNTRKRTRYQVRRKKKAPGVYTWNFGTNKRSLSRQIVAYVDMPPSNLAISGLLDPELVAWELTPFSFIIDWFINIGGYLEARALAQKLSGTFITTDKGVRETRNVTTQVGFPTNRAASNSIAKYDLNLSRSISYSLNVPLPSVKPLSEAASWQHMVNGIALTVGIMQARDFRKSEQKALDRWYEADRKIGGYTE